MCTYIALYAHICLVEEETKESEDFKCWGRTPKEIPPTGLYVCTCTYTIIYIARIIAQCCLHVHK